MCSVHVKELMASGGVSDHEELSSTIKQFHARLRSRAKEGKLAYFTRHNTIHAIIIPGSHNIEKIWSDHLKDREGLKLYSEAMQSLATGPWAQQGGGRISWCVSVCKEYYEGGALSKMIHKDLRRRGHNMHTLVPTELLPSSDADVARMVELFQQRKWKLLDVGSCYNPFSKCDEFEVTAIDIAPADPTVLCCDFLSVNISDSKVVEKANGGGLRHIKPGSFDVAIFSLLLSYLPSTQQRLKCCINAHKALCLHGLLLIITPDSSHQNRHAGMMKSWKLCIESLGFHRWKYIKDTHLHCIAFRKTQLNVDFEVCLGSHYMLCIPQDSHDELATAEESNMTDPLHTDTCTQSLSYTQLMELPFCDIDCDDND